MKEYNIQITRQARAHLRGLADYISLELKAPDAARNTISSIKSEIMSLKSMPERIKYTEEEPWRSEEVRRMRVKNYYVYFWIDKEKDIVQILAVIYVARDQKAQLEKLDME